MAKFQVRPTVGITAETFRMGTKEAPLVDADMGKAVKLGAESQVVLAGPDDEIFGFASSLESGTQDGYKIGGVVTYSYQAADTGVVAVGTLVVVDTNPATGTAGKTKVKAGAAASYATGTEAVATPNKYLWEVVHPGVIRRV